MMCCVAALFLIFTNCIFNMNHLLSKQSRKVEKLLTPNNQIFDLKLLKLKIILAVIWSNELNNFAGKFVDLVI